MQFVDVIGQSVLSTRLRDGVLSGRIAHAQLFEGTNGSGGLALARAYAQYLHCTDRTKEDSCGVCTSCLAHKKVQHPDLHWTFPFFKKDGSGNIVSSAKAKLEVDKKLILCEGEGNGPVHALDNAIRNNVDKLAKYSDYLKDLRLVDYKVRILNTGTEAVTRVSIESTDSKGKNWFTIGVSTNIIDASFKALVDSLDYKLFKDKAPASL